MRNVLRFSIVLGSIAIVAGLGVSGVYELTRGRIEAKKQKAFAAALLSVFPQAEKFTTAPSQDGAWEGEGIGAAVKGGAVVGYLAIGEKQGYSSTIRVLVGADPDFKIKAVRILEQAETPGLGERTKEVKTDRTVWQALGEVAGLLEKEAQSGDDTPWFQEQFEGRTLDELVVVKDSSSEGIQAITGATVSSLAVTEAVKDALARMKAEIAGGAPDVVTGPTPAWQGGQAEKAEADEKAGQGDKAAAKEGD